jgi:von Willebrand factor type A domain
MRTLSALAALLFVLGSLSCGGGDDAKSGDKGKDEDTDPSVSPDVPDSPRVDNPAFDNPDTQPGMGGGDAAGNGSSDDLPMGMCANGLVQSTRVAPRVVLVLDGSCSMSTNYPANGAQSASQCTNNANGRWAALRKALVDPQTGVVTKLQSVVEFGVVVFGTQPTCPIPSDPVKPALNNLATIQAKMPQVQPGMYTPTGPALDWVYKNLIEQSGPDDRKGPQIVILATDGEPNSCGGGGRNQSMTNYQPSIDAVKAGAMLGATTYVISLADATGPFHDHLQMLANLGNPAANGAAMLYEPASPDQLTSSLMSLVGAAVSCEIELKGSVEESQACTGRVTLDGQALGCNDPNGWALVDANHIKLQGEACQKLKQNNDASVQAEFSCTAFRPE